MDASAAEFSLSGLRPGSTYTAQLQAEGGEGHAAPVSTEFTTGSSCSQVTVSSWRL